MAAMFVVAGGVRWRERRQRVTLRRAGGGPSTAVIGSPQERQTKNVVAGVGEGAKRPSVWSPTLVWSRTAVSGCRCEERGWLK